MLYGASAEFHAAATCFRDPFYTVLFIPDWP